MLNQPVLKFNKSIKYLESQIDIQKNNKQLILDIISNIGLILNSSVSNNNKALTAVLDKANNFLQDISNNMIVLEQLNVEITNITKDLNDILSSQTNSQKTKEYYMAAFSNVKNNIVQYTENFQEIEKKLEVSNSEFNKFINDSNFKYNFNENSENNYEFTDFSVNDESASVSTDKEVSNADANNLSAEIDNDIDLKLLDYITIDDVTPSHDVIEEASLLEEAIEEELLNAEFSSLDIIEEPVVDTPASEDVVDDDVVEENIEVEETVVDTPVSGDVVDDDVVEENIEVEETVVDTPVSEDVVDDDVVEENTEVEETVVDTPVSEDVVDDDIADENIEVEETFVDTPVSEDVSPKVTINEEIIKEVENIVDNDYTEEISAVDVAVKEAVSNNSEIEDDNSLLEDISSDITEEVDVGLTDLLNENNKSKEPVIETRKIETEARTLLEYVSTENAPKKEVQKTSPRASYFETLIQQIESAEAKNKTLLICEKTDSIYLPYRISELRNYMEYYPKVYSSPADVVQQEFILSLSYFTRNPSKARFSETYNLVKNRSGKSMISALSRAVQLSKMSSLNPAIIAACKSDYELDCYLDCMKHNKLESFTFFKIEYDVYPF